MQVLSDILYKAGAVEIHGSTKRSISALSLDSRKVQPGGLFVAIRGAAHDGHAFIDKAVGLGAAAVVCESLPDSMHPEVTYIRVSDSGKALGWMATNFYDHPSSRLKLVGITGTNGKTTVVNLLFDLFTSLGYPCGLLSTVGNRIGPRLLEATHTTPDAISLNAMLADMVEAGCSHAFMEVSSHAAHQHRIEGLNFSVAIFSNITHDHLDYHGTFDNYIKAKKSFFDRLSTGATALVNRDDKNGMVMVQNTRARVSTYSLQNQADFRAKILENNFSGLHLLLDGTDFFSGLMGSFNAYNLLAAYATAQILGEDKLEVLTALSSIQAPSGRFEYVRSARLVTGIVDYAHTPDALENVLRTIRDIRQGNERIITVVGCGGDRDKAKRPVMAALAARFSDKTIFTSDNPRSEDPERILDEMMAGLKLEQKINTLRISDRAEAIRAACMLAQAGDIILVAGKGHETYQEIAGVRYPFDDKAELIKQLNS
ncbi:MAG: UDP-N-acetylmuramoyl-L-alanyl-D-glutamate--2,6-diaminopimelate ligase [Bacteroidia bacterium]